MGPQFQRGQILFGLKRYHEAVEAYQAELASNPDNPLVLAILGAALINLRRVRDADRAIRRALELAPDMAYAYYVLSFVYQRRNRLGKAERAIQESVRLEPSPSAFHQWATVAELRRNYAEALAATGEALRLDPQYGPAILLRGKLLAQAGRMEEAHALYAAALRNNPEDAAAHHALGALRLRVGDADAALGMLREARRLDPITTNDATAIAHAYGELLTPFKIVGRGIFHWNRLPPKRRWIGFALLAAIFAVAGAIYGSPGSRHVVAGPLAAGLCALLFNYAVLPFTFDLLATAVGAILLRREFGRRWWAVLSIQPLLIAPALAGHALATFVAIGACTEPSLGVMVSTMGAASPLLIAGVRNSPSRAAAWFCVGLYAVLAILGTFGAIEILYESIVVGVWILVFVFALAYFSDDIARSILWSPRRSSLLLE
jgi:Flp pilus assembly protein TadD